MAIIHLSRKIDVLRDDGSTVSLPAGPVSVPDDLAAHWYVKAHTVEPPAPEIPAIVEVQPEAGPEQEAEAEAKAEPKGRGK